MATQERILRPAAGAGAFPEKRAYAMPRPRARKRSELVALEIIRDITGRNLRHGDHLPLEADMLREYRVSRSSLREALRLLEVQGLITLRPGPGGGAVIGSADPIHLGRTMSLYLHMQNATYDQLLDAWGVAESTMARMAALNTDRARVESALAPFLATHDLADTAWTAHDGVGFHWLLAELSGNPVLGLIMTAIGSIQTDLVFETIERGALEPRIVHDHADLARAIIAGDAAEAERLMIAHCRHIAEDFRTVWPSRVGERIRWVS